jgi:hypothetical protein
MHKPATSPRTARQRECADEVIERENFSMRFVCESCGTEARSDPKAQLFCWPCAFPFFAVEETHP